MSQLSTQRFDWRPYVTISANFTQAERTALTDVLNDIAAVENGEGQALILRAATKNGGTIAFVPGVRNIYDDTQNRIEVSLSAAGRTVYKEHGVDTQASLNGVMVHELFHAGDTEPSNATVLQYARQQLCPMLAAYGYSPERQQQVLGEVERLLTVRTGRYFIHGLMTKHLERVLHQVSIKDQGFPELSELIAAIGPDELTDSLVAGNLVGTDRQKPWEQRAVAFTDQFMQRHYGAVEPQRGSYENGKLLDADAPVRILTHVPPSACEARLAAARLPCIEVRHTDPLPLPLPSQSSHHSQRRE